MDPRGYPLIYPNLLTFAVIPYEAEQFHLVLTGDIKRLRELFLNSLAGP